MKKISLKSVIVLVSICLVVAALMAAIHMLTQPKIDEANKKAIEEALSLVVADATEFVPVEGTYPETVTEVYRDVGGKGYAVMLKAKGYDGSNPMVIAAGFDAQGRLLKCHVVSCSGETSGIGTKVGTEPFLSQFVNLDSTMSGVDTISGATVSSSAFIGAVRDAFEAVSTAREVTP